MLSKRILIAAAVALTLSGCTPAPGDAIVMPEPPDAPLSVTGTVIDDGSGASYCPVVLESYPPECGGGLSLHDWDWEGLDRVYEEGEVRWGIFLITGTYDGERLSITQPPSAAEAWPSPPPSHTGSLTTDELNPIYEEVEDLEGVVDSSIADGFVIVDIYYDDGTIQSRFDERYGEGAVIVNSLLH